jgi:CBS domain-containing protein
MSELIEGTIISVIHKNEENAYAVCRLNSILDNTIVVITGYLAAIQPEDLINTNPIRIDGSATVFEMLQLIKKCSFPIMYLPVVNSQQNAIGIVNFVHLIKGEI